MERIMLGVTQVNGCLLCSYAHTKMALELGMKEKQIEELLDGELGNVPLERPEAEGCPVCSKLCGNER